MPISIFDFKHIVARKQMWRMKAEPHIIVEVVSVQEIKNGRITVFIRPKTAGMGGKAIDKKDLVEKYNLISY
jgi:hypothetical protein